MGNLKSKILLKIKDIKVIRLLSSPFVKKQREKELNDYIKSSHSKKISKLKNIYEGKRCFIIGNGPSLTKEDLELIADEYSFGTNRIHTLFDKTTWRPNFYVCEDKESFRIFPEEIKKIETEYKILNQSSYHIFGDSDNIFYMYNWTPFSVNYDINPGFSEDISKGMYTGQTVTFTCIQIAVYMGFKEIYLIGVDNNYAKTVDSKGKVVIDKSVQNYSPLIKDTGLGVNYIDGTRKAYKAARDYCDSHGVIIKNATRGGCLEIFERVKLEDIIGENSTK